MAVATSISLTTSRDWNDIIKFPGRFKTVTYSNDEWPIEVIHRIQFATPGGENLEPIDWYLAIKNLATYDRNNPLADHVVLYFQTQANASLANPPMEVTILAGHHVEFTDLDWNTLPTITSSTAANIECEIVYIGHINCEYEFGYCDLWSGGLKNGGAGTENLWHYPESGAWGQMTDPMAYDWLHDFYGYAPADYWAVGLGIGAATGYTGHWNGVAWSDVAIPPGGETLYGVWGFASDQVWAVGGAVGHFQVWFWDGATWVIEDAGLEVDPLQGIHGVDSVNLYACGGQRVYDRTAGTPWSLSATSDADWYGIWVESAASVWVVGDDTLGSGLIGHFIPGSGMTLIPAPAGIARLRGVWGFSGQDIWAVGDADSICHYDGVAWTAYTPGWTGWDYYAIFGCLPYRIWAVGMDEEGALNIHIFYNGWVWSVNRTGNQGGLHGVKGVWVPA